MWTPDSIKCDKKKYDSALKYITDGEALSAEEKITIAEVKIRSLEREIEEQKLLINKLKNYAKTI
jgi:hypothetical protein